MELRIDAFTTPKMGAKVEHNDDAFGPLSGRYSLTSSGLRVAIVDGATEGLLSRLWSHHIAENLSQGWGARVAWDKVVSTWSARKQTYVEQRERDGRPLQWYEEPGLQKPALATWLRGGVFARRDGSCRVTLRSVGDCCVFRPRNSSHFPPWRTEDFNCTPILASSDQAFGGLEIQRACWDDLRPGEGLYFATDALAQWIVQQLEQDRPPWRQLGLLDPARSGEFVRWVEERKEAGEMKDDDVTLLRIRIGTTCCE